jgi:hypothetical protein
MNCLFEERAKALR